LGIGLAGSSQRTAERVAARITPLGEKVGSQVVWQRDAEAAFMLTLAQPAETVTIRLFASGRIMPNPRSAPRPAGPIFEKEVNLAPALRGTYRAQFYLPKTLSNGMVDLEAEVRDGAKTARVPVQLADPPVRIIGLSGGKTVGGELAVIANFAPPNAKITLQRIQNAPFPKEYWAAHNSVGQSSFLLIPTVSKEASGNSRLKVTMPVKAGAGKFRVRIIGDNALAASDTREFSFDFPTPAPAVYSLRLDSIECLEETGEIGDDEIYALTVYGRIRPKDDPGYAIATVKRNGPMGFAKGQKKVLNSTIIQLNAPVEAYRTVWAVALLENDDDIPNGYQTALQQGNWNNHLREPYNLAMLGNTIVDAILAEKEDQKYHSNNDEYLGWKKIPLSDSDLQTAVTKPGWIPRSVVISGDGGRYRLTYSVSAAPKQG